uniref:Uncharacterized protein n=1 Tax=Gouania willdenowi TaxID=441366 RepID=A0A8C5FYP0_GOUWI
MVAVHSDGYIDMTMDRCSFRGTAPVCVYGAIIVTKLFVNWISTLFFFLDLSESDSQRREGPVQFEEDPFGLDKFLGQAKQYGGSKRPPTSTHPKDEYHNRKRRKA